MLETISSELFGLILGLMGRDRPNPELANLQVLAWQQAEVFQLPKPEQDPAVQILVDRYLDRLVSSGQLRDKQGVMIRSDWSTFAGYRETVPISAASLTKIATTLASLEHWSPKHRFLTQVYTVGRVKNGVLDGDLVIQGNDNPLFVWEEAIALGNAINQAGIQQITGDLLITGRLPMNFQSDNASSGVMLQQAMNQRMWSRYISGQYRAMPSGTAKPEVAIAQSMKVVAKLPSNAQLLLQQESLPLSEIVKQMNIYSNNAIAEQLAESLGGGAKVAQIAAKAAKIPAQEIQLINGSGLGVDNRISPRAVTAMLMALDGKLQNESVTLSDLFPVAGREHHGTLKHREIPNGVTAKTGTLNHVSALAGMIPTSEHGNIWFAVINGGNGLNQLRNQQDQLLQELANHWQFNPLTAMLTDVGTDYFGNPNRIKFVRAIAQAPTKTGRI